MNLSWIQTKFTLRILSIKPWIATTGNLFSNTFITLSQCFAWWLENIEKYDYLAWPYLWSLVEGILIAIEVPDKFIFSKIMTTFAYEQDEILKESSISIITWPWLGKQNRQVKDNCWKACIKFNFLSYDMGNSLCFTCVVSWLKKFVWTEFPFGPQILTLTII